MLETIFWNVYAYFKNVDIKFAEMRNCCVVPSCTLQVI